MQRRLLFLINPYAGKAEIKVKALDIIDLFVKSGYEVTVRTTQQAMEIPGLLRACAQDYQLVVCCGGDGTLNETVTGMMQCEQAPMLGYIPAGTVNDFASSLNLSKNMLKAAETVVTGVPFDCDIGAFEDRYFTYIAAFGAFTDVSYQTPQQSKNILGRAAYIIEGIKRLPAIKDYHMTVVHDGTELEGDFIFGMVTNAKSVGGFRVRGGVEVSLNDGLLEVVLIRRPASAAETTMLLNSVLRQELDSEFIVSFKTSAMTVEADSAVPWTLDGEYGGAVTHAYIENHPRAIRIIAGDK